MVVTGKHFWSKGVYLTILESIRNHGKLPSLNLSKQSLNRYISRLKTEGLIKRVGYGVWEAEQVNEQVNIPPKTSKHIFVRGHGFIWRLVFPKEINVSIVQFLIKRGIAYKHNKGVVSFLYEAYHLWWSSKSMVLYTPEDKSFYSSSAEASKKLGFYEVAYIIKNLEQELKVSLKCGSQYILKLCRQHYADVDNVLARQRIRDNKPLSVATDEGEWLLVDLSQGVPELETVHPKTSLKDMDDVILPFFNDLKLNMPPLPSEMWRILAAEVKNWELYAVNMQSHVEAVKSLSEGVKELRQTISELKGDKPQNRRERGFNEELEGMRWERIIK